MSDSHLISCPIKRERVSGFSLLELLVVIAIIAVLTSYVAPRFLGSVNKSEIQTARMQIDAFIKALESFRLDVGRYPVESEGLPALIAKPGGVDRWRGPYLKKEAPVDPWGTPYQYRMPGMNGLEFSVVSLGSDRRPGGTGDAADISD